MVVQGKQSVCMRGRDESQFIVNSIYLFLYMNEMENKSNCKLHQDIQSLLDPTVYFWLKLNANNSLFIPCT